MNQALARAARGSRMTGSGFQRRTRWSATVVRALLDAGHGQRLLLCQDRGWFDPAQPGGGTPKPFTYLSDVSAEAPRQRHPSIVSSIDAVKRERQLDASEAKIRT